MLTNHTRERTDGVLCVYVINVLVLSRNYRYGSHHINSTYELLHLPGFENNFTIWSNKLNEKKMRIIFAKASLIIFIRRIFIDDVRCYLTKEKNILGNTVFS